MNIKSLLLGSAAALVAVSGAQAADVIVADPEPVEYVRICDAYGTGFFYIPGTETCLKIGGYVRYDAGFGDLNDVTAAAGDETWNKRARAQVTFDAREETEYGTLRGYIETRWQWDTNGGRNEATFLDPATFTTFTTRGPNGYSNTNEFSINFAFIELGGLRIGKDESFFTTFTGYGGSVINDTTGGGYGPFDTNLITYRFNVGGFSGGISLEEGVDNYWIDADRDGLADGLVGWGIDDYVPHIVAGAGYEFGPVNLRAVFGYDTRDDFIVPDGGALAQVGGWAAKLRADVDITSGISAFAMVMYGENTSAYTTWATGAATGETWSVLGGLSASLTEKATFNTQIQWAEGNGGSDVWHVAANVNYNVTPNFIVRPEVQWLRDNGGDNSWGGVVRFQRNF